MGKLDEAVVASSKERKVLEFFKNVDDPIVVSPDEKVDRRSMFGWVEAVMDEKLQIHHIDDLVSFEPFLVAKAISMKETTLPGIIYPFVLTKHLNKLDSYRYFLNALPNCYGNNKYLTKKRDEKDVARELIISRHFGTGSRDTLALIDSMSRDELMTVLESYPEWKIAVKKSGKK